MRTHTRSYISPSRYDVPKLVYTETSEAKYESLWKK